MCFLSFLFFNSFSSCLFSYFFNLNFVLLYKNFIYLFFFLWYHLASKFFLLLLPLFWLFSFLIWNLFYLLWFFNFKIPFIWDLLHFVKFPSSSLFLECFFMFFICSNLSQFFQSFFQFFLFTWYTDAFPVAAMLNFQQNWYILFFIKFFKQYDLFNPQAIWKQWLITIIVNVIRPLLNNLDYSQLKYSMFCHSHCKVFWGGFSKLLDYTTPIHGQLHCFFLDTTKWFLMTSLQLQKLWTIDCLLHALMLCWLVHYESLCDLHTSCMAFIPLYIHWLRRHKPPTYVYVPYTCGMFARNTLLEPISSLHKQFDGPN